MYGSRGAVASVGRRYLAKARSSAVASVGRRYLAKARSSAHSLIRRRSNSQLPDKPDWVHRIRPELRDLITPWVLSELEPWTKLLDLPYEELALSYDDFEDLAVSTVRVSGLGLALGPRGEFTWLEC